MRAYEDCLSATSTKWAPWYVVPADHKWVTRAVVADVVTTAIRSLDLKYPEVTDEQQSRPRGRRPPDRCIRATARSRAARVDYDVAEAARLSPWNAAWSNVRGRMSRLRRSLAAAGSPTVAAWPL